MEQERRASTRKSFGQEVVVNHEKGLRFCKLQNISEGGAFLDIGWVALTRNVPIELSINLRTKANTRESLKVHAQVARVSTDGTAVSFENLDRQALQAISNFITA